jgi:hypothetical protein
MRRRLTRKRAGRMPHTKQPFAKIFDHPLHGQIAVVCSPADETPPSFYLMARDTQGAIVSKRFPFIHPDHGTEHRDRAFDFMDAEYSKMYAEVLFALPETETL